MANRKHLINVHTSTGTTAPTEASLYLGEIAVQHTPNEPAIWIKMGSAETSTEYEKFIGETEIINMLEETKILGSGYTYSGLSYIDSSTTIADAFSALTNELIKDEKVTAAAINELNVKTNEINSIKQIIREDEEVTAGAINLLNERVAGVETHMSGDYIQITGYELASGSTEEELTLREEDTVNEAFGKLQKQMLDNEEAIAAGLNDLNNKVDDLEEQIEHSTGVTQLSGAVMTLSAATVAEIDQVYQDMDEGLSEKADYTQLVALSAGTVHDIAAVSAKTAGILTLNLNGVEQGQYCPSASTVINLEAIQEITGADVLLTGYELASGSTEEELVVLASDTVNEAFGKLQKQNYDNEAVVAGALNDLDERVAALEVGGSVEPLSAATIALSAATVALSSSTNADIQVISADTIELSAATVTNSGNITALSAATTGLSAATVVISNNLTALSATTTGISNNVTTLSAATTGISNNLNVLSAATTGISNNVTALSAATTGISNNLNTLSAATVALSSATKADIQAVSADTIALSAATVTISGNVTSLSGATTGISNNLTALSAATTGISRNVTALSAATVVVSNNLTSLSAATTGLSNNVTALSAATVTNSGNITALSAATTGISKNLNALSAATTGLSSNVTSLSAATVLISNNVTALSAATTGISKNITALSAATTGISSNVTALSAATTGLSDNVTSLSAATTGISRNVTSLSAATTGLSAATVVISNNLNALSAATTGISRNVTALSAATTGISNNLNVLSAATKGLSSNVTALSASTTGLSNNLNALSGATTGISRNVTALSASTTGLSAATVVISNNVTSLSAATTGISRNVTSLSAATTGISRNVTSLSAATTGLSSNLTALSAATTGIESGLETLSGVVIDNELVTAEALISLNNKVAELSGNTSISELSGAVMDMSYVVAMSLNDLNNKENALSAGTVAAITDLEDKIDELSGNTGFDGFEKITWSALKTLRDSSGLTPGKQYRITDYNTTTSQADTQAAGHQFDIIVVADSVNKLNENARAVLHNGDTYFSTSGANLNAWEIKYSLDNDTKRFAWAVTGSTGRGVIYYMKDEWNNECPYDFKNIQFKRKLTNGAYNTGGVETFVYTFNAYDSDNRTINDASVIVARDAIDFGTQYCFSNAIKPAYSIYSGNIEICVLNNIVFLNLFSLYGNFFECYFNTFGSNGYSNTFGNNCKSNTFRNECTNNTFGRGCSNNTFGNSCSNNTFGDNCNSNTFGNSCSNNTFGDSCDSNTFRNDCTYNTIGGVCLSSTFGTYCSFNTLGVSCCYNTFGNKCENIIFSKDHVYNVIIENGNRYITLTSTQTPTGASPLRNITIAQGVNNSTTVKTISHNTLNDTFKTTYQSANSQIINI